MRYPSHALLIVALLTAAAGPLAANPEDEARARALFKECNQRYRQHDIDGALRCYRDTYEIWANPKILLNWGAVLRDEGRNVEAIEIYDRVLRSGAAEAERDLASQALDDLLLLVGTLEIHGPAGAKVTIDERDLGALPLAGPIYAPPGEHKLVFRVAGAAPIVVIGSAIAGEVTIITAPTRPAPPLNPPASDAPGDRDPPGARIVIATPPATYAWRQRDGIYVDGSHLDGVRVGVGLGRLVGPLELGAGVQIGPSPALSIDATWAPWRGHVTPYVLVGALVTHLRPDVDDAMPEHRPDAIQRPSAHAAIGVEVPVWGRISGYAELGIDYMIAAPDDYPYAFMLVPAGGAKVGF